jgi:hypothetical protein
VLLYTVMYWQQNAPCTNLIACPLKGLMSLVGCFLGCAQVWPGPCNNTYLLIHRPYVPSTTTSTNHSVVARLPALKVYAVYPQY